VTRALDASHVDLHRAGSDTVTVERAGGAAQRLREGAEPEDVYEGMELRVGDTVALEAGAEVVAGGFVFRGGNGGRAHALVAPTAFRASPTRGDVPQLLEQLAQLEREGGVDPVAAKHPPPKTPYERASAAEFARLNLSLPAARLLSERTARALRAVVLFVSDETAFVAFEAVDAGKLRAVMEHLERPTNAHVVPGEVVDELIARVYGASGPSSNWS
jgi:hypothetical protein